MATSFQSAEDSWNKVGQDNRDFKRKMERDDIRFKKNEDGGEDDGLHQSKKGPTGHQRNERTMSLTDTPQQERHLSNAIKITSIPKN